MHAARGETLSFLWPAGNATRRRGESTTREAVHLSILDPRDQRTGHGVERADLRALDALLDRPSTADGLQ